MSKGNTLANNGDELNQASNFSPVNTARPMATNNCEPRLA